MTVEIAILAVLIFIACVLMFMCWYCTVVGEHILHTLRGSDDPYKVSVKKHLEAIQENTHNIRFNTESTPYS